MRVGENRLVCLKYSINYEMENVCNGYVKDSLATRLISLKNVNFLN